jgi:hypothetical protein
MAMDFGKPILTHAYLPNTQFFWFGYKFSELFYPLYNDSTLG